MGADVLQTSLLGATTLGGRYRPIRRVGSGGMGTVWEADDLVLHRRVAVKILSPSLCENETVAARFYREAQAAGRLVHPNIAAVFDYGEEQGCPFIVLELVAGRTLREVLDERRRLPVDEAVGVAAQVADALAAAHAQGIIHRDVKPGNVMITTDGRVKVMDFGIADASWFEPITDTGMVMATARYISPEQATGSSGGPASDVYSLGIVLYEMLAGRPPFEASSPFAVAAAHAYEVPPPVTRFASVGEPVVSVIELATRKDARERPTAQALADRLRTIDVAPTAAVPVRTGSHDDTVVLAPATAGRARVRDIGWLWAAAVLLGLLIVVSLLVAATSGAPELGGHGARRDARIQGAVGLSLDESVRDESEDAGDEGHGEGASEGQGHGPGNGNGEGHGED